MLHFDAARCGPKNSAQFLQQVLPRAAQSFHRDKPRQVAQPARGCGRRSDSQRTSAPEKSEKHAPTSFSATLGHFASLVEYVPTTSSCTPRAQASPAPSWGRRLRHKQGAWHGYFVILDLVQPLLSCMHFSMDHSVFRMHMRACQPALRVAVRS